MNTLGKAPERLQVHFVFTTEGVQGLGLRLTGLRIAVVMGQLHVTGDGTVLVFSANDTDIHVHMIRHILQMCKHKNEVIHNKTHAYTKR